MAGIFTDYWRIVKPSPAKMQYVSTNPENAKLFSNFSWYTKVMKGASSRFSKYTQYRNMDADVFVARALDTIAEEMTQVNPKTNLPFEIIYQNESNEEVDETLTMTIRAALRHWCDLQNIHIKLFDIARTAVKYGDCFFKKTSDFKQWQYIEPGDVIGITIDAEGVPEFYHVRSGDKNKQGAFGDVTIIPAKGMVQFSMTSSMGENGPFGESILWPCIKAFRHLTLLEDSIIIYRIVRAPERRVFSIDTGNMPPQRVKAYLDAIKTEMRQKRIPNDSGGQETIDSVYNPMSFDLSTQIPLLDGRILPLSSLIEEHSAGKKNWVYSCDPVTGAVAPGEVVWAGITQRDVEIYRITLDNGKTIDCTPEHRFPVLGGKSEGVRADELTPEHSLISFERRQVPISRSKKSSNLYERVFDHELNEWIFTHRMVAEHLAPYGEIATQLYKDAELGLTPVVHHVDYNRFNNSPTNLAFMNKADHMLFHKEQKKSWWDTITPERRLEIRQLIAAGTKKAMAACDQSYKVRQKVALKKWNDDMKRDHADVYLDQRSRGAGCMKTALVTQEMLGSFMVHVNAAAGNQKLACKLASEDQALVTSFLGANNKNLVSTRLKFTPKRFLESVYQTFGYKGWKHLAESAKTYNHRIVSVQKLPGRADAGCITVENHQKYHTFALDAGVFTKNSMNEDYFFANSANGRGSTVTTLPGGDNLGEISDLTYFQNKFLQGLRIPSSYMRGGQDGTSQVTDGKVGIAYIEEVRFANFVSRLQSKINDEFEDQFKAYLSSAGLNIDPHLFKLKLVDPSNYQTYRQAEVDEKLIGNFSNLKDVPFMSSRYMMMHYLGMSEDDIQENEVMLKQERGIPDKGVDEKLDDLRMMYDPKWIENRPDIKVDDDFDDHTDAAGGDDAGAEGGEDEDEDKDVGDAGSDVDKGADEATPDKGDEKPDEKGDEKPDDKGKSKPEEPPAK